jgi:hypothetical protein
MNLINGLRVILNLGEKIVSYLRSNNGKELRRLSEQAVVLHEEVSLLDVLHHFR